MKTAYIELNTTNQISSLSNNGSLDSFVYMGIHIFPSTKVTSLSTILCKNFDYFILDMGVLTNYTAIEFSKCHKQFLVCNLNEWKKQISLNKIKDLFQKTNLRKDSVLILNTNNKSTGLNLFKMKIKSFPFLSNPFQLTVDMFNDLNQILERN